ncbi:nucleotide disphospho-sugar-binding domain-containing protein [Ornithinimicrobium sp. Y1847]|uniref:nucleotide disphospho-sugar-binding domain-containing protein n=1 Tax=unclassified Ornithinimicrobium TaxID=2615080 RepID=UPI003B67CA86
MAHILVSAVPHTGHVQPILHVIEALAARGHEVRAYVGSTFAAAAEERGAQVVPMEHGIDYDETTVERVFGERPMNPVRRLSHDIAQIFVGSAPGDLLDLRGAVADRRPDVIVSDNAHLPSALLAELEHLPFVALGIQPVITPDPWVPPFGPGLRPARGPAGRSFQGLLGRVSNRLVMGRGDRLGQQIRADLGLPRREGSFMNWPGEAATAYLQSCAPELDYPRQRPLANVEFVGPVFPPPREDVELPAWWGDLLAAREAGRKVVLVTQGTVAVDPDNLIRPTVQGLAGEDVFVVATAARLDRSQVVHVDLAAPDGGPVRATIRVEDFVPFDRLLPHVDVMVSNGGYGGVQLALAHGVPLVTSGVSEDKREVGARVGWSGVGIALQKQRPTPDKLRAAIRSVLDEPR